MKAFFIWGGYFLLALLLLLLEGLFRLFVGLPLWLWEKVRYAAQCLRWPPPPGGMYGEMARRMREKDHAD